MADYKSTTVRGKCIFCEIINGNIDTPGKFWEDGQYIAFLSKWPNTEGFSVVVPKKHFSSDVLSMSDENLSRFVITAKKVSRILIDYFEDVGRIGLIIEGTGVDHAHIKLFPMHGTELLAKGEWKQHHSETDMYFEKYSGYISSNDGPAADEEQLRKLAESLRRSIDKLS